MNTTTLDRPEPRGAGRPGAPSPWWPPPPPKPPRGMSAELRIPMPVLATLATLCTTLCLGNLFEGIRWWFYPSLGAIVVAAIVGELGRRVRAPLAVMPLLYAVAGWLYVIPVAAGDSGRRPGVGLWPTGDTFTALRDLANSGSTDIRALTVPVPDRPGFLFLTVAGVFVIAALVDAIAVGLDRPAAAGLPLLALLAVPAAVVERGVGLLAFVAACLSYLAMLLSSGRHGFVRWARVPAGAAAGIRQATGATGRRIGAIAVVAALFLPVLIPRYTGVGRHRSSGSGGGSATVIEPVVTLAQQLHSDSIQPLLTVHTQTPEYLRLASLEHFDGQRFTLGSLSAGRDARVSHGLPAPAKGSTAEVKATIDVENVLHQRYLPTPYQATQVAIDGDWRLSGRTFTIFSAQNDTSGAHYSVTSQVATPTAEALRAQTPTGSLAPEIDADINLPNDLPVEISELAARLTASYPTEYDKAAAIQAYLRGPLFTYDLKGAPIGNNALADFLLRDHRGYCEQFAGAMVVLAREAGIPARVAVGFTPGTRQADGSWLITNHDAHSWPEIWFPQAGWIRFEPTKRDDSTTAPDYTQNPQGGAPAPIQSADPKSQATAAPSGKASQPAAGPSSGLTSGAGSSGGGLSFPATQVLGWSGGAAVGVVLLLAPARLRRRRRRRRLDDSSAGWQRDAWREIVDTAVDLGVDVPATLSPRRTVQRWSRLSTGERVMPDAASKVLAEVAHAEERFRYAPQSSAGADPAVAWTAQEVRDALHSWEHSRESRVRLRALLAPRSMRPAARTVLAGESGPGADSKPGSRRLALRRLRSRPAGQS